MSKNTILIFGIILSNVLFITLPLYKDNEEIKKELGNIRMKNTVVESESNNLYSNKYNHIEDIINISNKSGFTPLSEKIEFDGHITLDLKFRCNFHNFQNFISLLNDSNKEILIEECYFNFGETNRDSYILIKYFGGDV